MTPLSKTSLKRLTTEDQEIVSNQYHFWFCPCEDYVENIRNYDASHSTVLFANFLSDDSVVLFCLDIRNNFLK